MTQSLYYSKRNQKCCHQSQKSQTFVFSNRSSQMNFLVKNWDSAIVVKKNWFYQRHSLFCRKSLSSLVLTGTLMHWILLSAVRFDRNLSDADAPIPIWVRCRSLLSDKRLPIWQVGFPPYLPYPVTKYDTVFTVVYNLATSNIAFLSSAMKGFTALLQRFSWSSLNIFKI